KTVGSIGFSPSNYIGFSISSAGSASASYNGINFKHSSTGFTLSLRGGNGGNYLAQGIGVGYSSFNNSVSIGDYITSENNRTASLFIPTKIGMFSLAYGIHKIKYWLNKQSTNNVIGPLYYNDDKYVVSWYDPSSLNVDGNRPKYFVYGSKFFRSHQEALNYADELSVNSPQFVITVQLNNRYISFENSFFDINEFVASNNFEKELDIHENNPTLPSFDNFNVQSEGISGSFK